MRSAFAAVVMEGGGGQAADAKPKVEMVMTQPLMIKIVAACFFGAATLYYLKTGRERGSFGRLLWAGVFGLLTCLVFAV